MIHIAAVNSNYPWCGDDEGEDTGTIDRADCLTCLEKEKEYLELLKLKIDISISGIRVRRRELAMEHED